MPAKPTVPQRDRPATATSPSVPCAETDTLRIGGRQKQGRNDAQQGPVPGQARGRAISGQRRIRAELTPPTVMARSAQLLGSFRRSGEMAMNAMVAEGSQRYSFWEPAVGRHLPDGVALGALRTYAALHSVHSDLREGRLLPQDFGQPTWDRVSAAAMFSLAERRIRSDRVDLDAAATRLAADRDALPMVLTRQNGERIPLTSDAINIVGRAPEDALGFIDVAEGFIDSELGQRARELAVGASDSRDSAESAATIGRLGVNLARAMLDGTESSHPTASQVAPLLALATNTSAIASDPAPTDTTVEAWMARVEAETQRGEALGAGVIPGPSLVRYRVRTSRELIDEIRRRLAAGELAFLDEQTRTQLGDIVGPSGAALEQRVVNEAADRAVREQWSNFTRDAMLFTSGAVVGAPAGALAFPEAVRLHRRGNHTFIEACGDAVFARNAELPVGASTRVDATTFEVGPFVIAVTW